MRHAAIQMIARERVRNVIKEEEVENEVTENNNKSNLFICVIRIFMNESLKQTQYSTYSMCRQL